MNDVNKKSTSINFAYSSLGLFCLSFFTCAVDANIGGYGLLLSAFIGFVAFVIGLVEKNTKAWALGLIAPCVFVALTIIGAMHLK